MAKKYKKISMPNNKTLWSYFMQSIELTNVAFYKAFPEHHPMWVIKSQAKDVDAKNFQYLRLYVLNLTQKQCAAYLRVGTQKISSWESGKTKVPFMVIELLRLLSECQDFKLSNQKWQGWFIDREGRLVSPDRGQLSFAPEELSYIREAYQAKAIYESEITRLRAELKPLNAEVVELRATLAQDSVLTELRVIEAGLAALSAKIKATNVIALKPLLTVQSVEEKAA